MQMIRYKLNEFDRINSLNVILIGIAGSGKTVLGNILAEQCSNESPNSMGQSIDRIENIVNKSTNSCLQLIDTPGFDPYNYATVFKSIRNYISDRNSSRDYRAHVHIGLLCVPESRRRFEDGELNVVRMLIDCGVTPIIVVTQSIDDQHSSIFIDELRRILSEVNPIPIPIVSILAADFKLMNNYIVEAYGIDSLLKTIADKTSETLTKSIAYAQKPKYGQLRLVANWIRNIYDRYFTRKNTIISVGIFLIIWYGWPYIYPKSYRFIR